MHVDPDAKIIRDSRLTLIRAISTLYDQLVDNDDALKDQVKATMKAKGATYAESDHVIARLQNGRRAKSYSFISPRNVFDLIAEGVLTLDQFLACVTVRADALADYLGKARIAAMTQTGSSGGTDCFSLVTEFKPGVVFDVEEMADVLQHALQAAQAKPAE